MHMQSLTEAIKISSAEAEREQIALREQTEVVSVKIKKAEADLDVAKQEYAEASENLIRVSRRVSQQNLRLLGGNKLDLVSNMFQLVGH
jgi:tryptophanyl-tRNA synthetase